MLQLHSLHPSPAEKLQWFSAHSEQFVPTTPSRHSHAPPLLSHTSLCEPPGLQLQAGMIKLMHILPHYPNYIATDPCILTIAS